MATEYIDSWIWEDFCVSLQNQINDWRKEGVRDRTYGFCDRKQWAGASLSVLTSRLHLSLPLGGLAASPAEDRPPRAAKEEWNSKPNLLSFEHHGPLPPEPGALVLASSS